jgi:hypothetical protein
VSSYASKAVSFGPQGTKDLPSSSNWQTVEYMSGNFSGPDSLAFMNATGTEWVKLWVDPLSIWPSRPGPDPTRVAELDDQIALAKFYGWHVILTFNNLRWPSWINGDPTNPASLPTSTGTTSGFGVFLWYFAQRYNQFNPDRPANGYSWVDVIEPFNEPNLAPGDPGLNAADTGDLMLTAKRIVGMTGNAPIVAGPATSDVYGSAASPVTRAYDTFTANVLAQLQVNGFYEEPNSHVFVWSQHNYGDILYDLGADSAYTGGNVLVPSFNVGDVNVTRVQRTHQLLLDGNWRGWPDGGAIPYIFLTEGGVIPARVARRWTAASGMTGNGGQDGQARLLRKNWTRMRTDTDGEDVVLGTQYLWYDSSAGDYSGLITRPLPFTERAAYSVWATLPSG